MITPRFVPRSRVLRRAARQRRAFTVLEMLVALAVFSVLLAAVFIPIKLAGDLSGVATARASSQQAAVDAISQMRRDIQRAIVILPNDNIPGITSAYPYNLNNGYPYRRDSRGYQRPSDKETTDGLSDLTACRPGNDTSSTTVTVPAVVPAPSTARLDLILPASNEEGTVDPQLRNNNVLVTYYARRRDIRKAFDPINNPVVLFRAQIPFQYRDNSKTLQVFPAWDNSMAYNADLSNQRFDKLASTSCTNHTDPYARSLQWITMNQYGEFDLTPLALPGASYVRSTTTNYPTFGSHQLVLPSDVSLITPNAASDSTADKEPTMSLVPDTTFICSDANKDGKLDTVMIELSVGQYDENSVNRRTIPTPTPGPSGASTTPIPHAVLQPQIAQTVNATVFDPNIQ